MVPILSTATLTQPGHFPLPSTTIVAFVSQSHDSNTSVVAAFNYSRLVQEIASIISFINAFPLHSRIYSTHNTLRQPLLQFVQFLNRLLSSGESTRPLLPDLKSNFVATSISPCGCRHRPIAPFFCCRRCTAQKSFSLCYQRCYLSLQMSHFFVPPNYRGRLRFGNHPPMIRKPSYHTTVQHVAIVVTLHEHISLPPFRIQIEYECIIYILSIALSCHMHSFFVKYCRTHSFAVLVYTLAPETLSPRPFQSTPHTLNDKLWANPWSPPFVKNPVRF